MCAMSAAGGAGRGLLAVGLVIGVLVGAVGGYVALGSGTAVTTTETRIQTATSTQTLVSSTTVTVSVSPSQSTTSSSQTSTSSVATVPAPVPVSVGSQTTALLVLDYVFCYRMTGCNATLPTIQTLIANARTAGVPIIYTRAPVPKEIANQSADTVITNDVGPDKFFNTSLASILQSKGIKTLVMVGIASNGALLYTAQEGCVRHYTVVVPVDTIVGTAYVQGYVPYQLLNGPGCGNANNTPLSPNHATMSTTSGITFKPGP